MSKPLTKNEFTKYINSKGGNCRYQGTSKTMFVHGINNKALIASMPDTAFKIVFQ